MLSSRLASPRLLLALTLAALTPACADPSAAFDDFVKRSPPPAPKGDCPDAYIAPQPGDIDGDFFQTLLTSVNVEKPLYLLTTVTTSDLDGGLGLAIKLQPLDKVDRKTPIGDPLDVPAVAVGEDGKFTIDIPELVIPAAANSLAAVAATATVKYEGNVCGDGSFICGDVSGEAGALGQTFDLTGSTFTFQRITDPASYPDPVLNCEETPFVPAM